MDKAAEVEARRKGDELGWRGEAAFSNTTSVGINTVER